MSETKQCSVCHCPLAPLDDNGNGTHRYLYVCLDLLNADVNRLKKENTTLVAALQKFGWHKSYCDILSENGGDRFHCSCGFEKALAGAEKGNEK